MFLWRFNNKQLIDWLWDKIRIPVVLILLLLIAFSGSYWIAFLGSFTLWVICLIEAEQCRRGSPKAIHRLISGSRFFVKGYVLMRYGNIEDAFQAVMANSRLRRYLVIEMYVWSAFMTIPVLIAFGLVMGYLD